MRVGGVRDLDAGGDAVRDKSWLLLAGALVCLVIVLVRLGAE